MKFVRVPAALAIAAVSVALTSVTPAIAKHKQHHHRVMPAPGGAVFAGTVVGPVFARPPGLPGDYYGTPEDPYGVYWGPQFLGRDADPAIRRSLLHEYFETHGR